MPTKPSTPWPELPIRSCLPALLAALADAGRAVLVAPPGSGKTTLLPLALLDADWLDGRRILILEPRRLAARLAAERMAALLGEAVGERVGYRIQLERRISPQTRIEVVTEGVLTRMLQADPTLDGVGAVLFDEFHERSLHADLALALTLDARAALRPGLRLVVMSATLDGERLSRLLDDAPVVRGEGRPHPVEIRYRPSLPGEERVAAVARTARRALADDAGDLLLFLPGQREIRATAARLDGVDAAVRPLYGEQGREAQQQALRPDPGGRRRIVLATAVAETSLTIEGIAVVVDSGLSRRPGFDPNSGLPRLDTVAVSQATAEQRAGRAGRLGPGIAYRIWSEAEQARLIPHHPPEIDAADLAPLRLELLSWGVDDPATLRWLDPPPAGAYAQAGALLVRLGALDRRGRITPFGRAIARLPLHPRLARMVVAGGGGERVRLLAALLSERDPLRGDAARGDADVATRLAILASDAATATGFDRDTVRRIRTLARRRGGASAETPEPPPSDGVLLALAYPDRIARRQGEHGLYRLANGRAARLRPDDPLCNRDWLVAAQVDLAGRDGRIFLAAAIEPTEIEERLDGLLEWVERIEWDAAARAVVARRERRLGALLLSEQPLPAPPPERVAAALLDGVRRLGIEALPWNDAAQSLRVRVGSLRLWEPDGGWPDYGAEALAARLDAWLGPWVEGLRRFDQLRGLDLFEVLKADLGWERCQRLERLAPTHLRVPSGSRKRIDYRPGEPPVLAVRLQELFGLRESPRVADGRVAVVLHLLSPAQRPVQVTQDLASFWRTTYAEVRKELKGRYPKHYWPEDPFAAVPTARVRPR